MRSKIIHFETDHSLQNRSWKYLQEFSESKGLPLQFSTEPAQDLASLKARDELLAIRCSLNFSQTQMKFQTTFPADVSQVKGFDHWIYQGHQFWPRLLLASALRELIVLRAGSLDLRQACFISSEGISARVAAWVAAGLGFSKLVFVGDNNADLQVHMDQISKTIVGVKSILISESELTLQNHGCSLLINTLDLEPESPLLGNLSYFNFMREGGVIVDTSSQSMEQPLIVEARGAELLGISHWEIQAGLDYRFLQEIYQLNQKDPHQAERYRRFLSFDLNQFIELFQSENLTSV